MMKPSACCIALASVVALSGCADDQLKVSGQASITLHPTTGDARTDRFEFPANTVVEASENANNNPFGSCSHAGNRWEIDLNRPGDAGDSLKGFHLSVPDTNRGDTLTGSFRVGQSTFTTSINCNAAAVSQTDGVQVSVTCTGLRAPADTRSADVSVSLSFVHCT